MGFFKNSEVMKHYHIGAQLGSGNFAVVNQAKKRATHDATIPKDVAIKIIDKSKVEDMSNIQNEIDIMTMVKHPNVIALFEIYDEQKTMNLIMELVTGGELFDRIVAKGSYTEADAAKTIYALCDALHYLHQRNVVHYDLKPENILYSDPSDDATIKVADFGLAKVVSPKDLMKTACGTPGYVSPEVLKQKGFNSGAVDIWSTGVILYILLCGFPPFYEEELPKLFDQILHARYDFPSPFWDNISKGAKDLVAKMLELDTNKRLTAKQVMESEWVVQCLQGISGTNQLPETIESLKKYNASRKLKKAAHGIRMVNKLKLLGKE
eukprot:CAMPEP_0119308292 /NCGR_PEP_ID=MMETSP1333-20130426/9917_1 /TAXON_ID=418940 /ORGANISM="Scyphosphaera apsteinii, Strain RCC1455" /LENGTH=322 /DNA_ID=CAMNT_0007312025 /DNA_START=33 /DNA_END=1001 /DNA_ORIENTATION=+